MTGNKQQQTKMRIRPPHHEVRIKTKIVGKNCDSKNDSLLSFALLFGVVYMWGKMKQESKGSQTVCHQ